MGIADGRCGGEAARLARDLLHLGGFQAEHDRRWFRRWGVSEIFRKLAHKSSIAMGSAWAFLAALALIAGWAVSGPFFQFSDTWELVINTTTTIITFLMVFLIQNTQNRDSQALHLKLDELLRAQEKARNSLVDLEDLSDAELRKLQEEFARLRAQGDSVLERAAGETGPRQGE